MDLQITGKLALVTGSAKGLGREIALILAKEGADVVLADVADMTDTAEAVQALDRVCEKITVDISDEQQIDDLFNQIDYRFGRLDILINNAGLTQQKLDPSVDLAMDEWDRIMAVNLRGTFMCCRMAAMMMIPTGSGSMVNVASTAGLTGMPRAAAYGASQAALVAITQSLALEWASNGIRVNAVAPHYMETGMTASLRRNKKVFQALTRRIPLKRFAQPVEVAQAAVVLASEVSGYSTGSVVTVDGGYLAV